MNLYLRHPSKNSPLIPPLLYLLTWVVSKLYIFFGLKIGLSTTMVLGSLGFISILLIVVALIDLIILVSFLLKLKFKELIISTFLCAVLGIGLSFIDDLLFSYEIKSVVGGMGNYIKPSKTRNYGASPVFVCSKLESGVKKCNVCYCPLKMDLRKKDNILYCDVANSKDVVADEKIKATCSDFRTMREDQRIWDIKDLFENDLTKVFALYIYSNNKAQFCVEHRTWKNWNVSNMSKMCSLQNLKCAVRDEQTCTELNAKKVCKKSNTNTHEAIRLISYEDNSSDSLNWGFSHDECESKKLPQADSADVNKNDRSTNMSVVTDTEPKLLKINSNITYDSDGAKVNLDKDAFVRLDLNDILMNTRMLPFREEGEIKGYKFLYSANSFFDAIAFQSEDILISYNDKKVQSIQSLMEFINELKKNMSTQILIKRNGKDYKISITFSKIPDITKSSISDNSKSFFEVTKTKKIKLTVPNTITVKTKFSFLVPPISDQSIDCQLGLADFDNKEIKIEKGTVMIGEIANIPISTEISYLLKNKSDEKKIWTLNCNDKGKVMFSENVFTESRPREIRSLFDIEDFKTKCHRQSGVVQTAKSTFDCVAPIANVGAVKKAFENVGIIFEVF